MYQPSVLQCLDHFITSPDTPVNWILCGVNCGYFRFPCPLDRQIPTQIRIIIIFLDRPSKLNKD